MIAVPVSFTVMMVFGLILTATVFSDQLIELVHSILTNHNDLSSGEPVPCYARVYYPARKL